MARRYGRYEEPTQVFRVLYPAWYARAAQLHQPSEGALSYQAKQYGLWKAPDPLPCFLISDESIIDENQQ